MLGAIDPIEDIILIPINAIEFLGDWAEGSDNPLVWLVAILGMIVCFISMGFEGAAIYCVLVALTLGLCCVAASPFLLIRWCYERISETFTGRRHYAPPSAQRRGVRQRTRPVATQPSRGTYPDDLEQRLNDLQDFDTLFNREQERESGPLIWNPETKTLSEG